MHRKPESKSFNESINNRWKVRRHGCSKRHTWRKLHVGMGENTQEIAAAGSIGNDKNDAATAEKMLK